MEESRTDDDDNPNGESTFPWRLWIVLTILSGVLLYGFLLPGADQGPRKSPTLLEFNR